MDPHPRGVLFRHQKNSLFLIAPTVTCHTKGGWRLFLGLDVLLVSLSRCGFQVINGALLLSNYVLQLQALWKLRLHLRTILSHTRRLRLNLLNLLHRSFRLFSFFWDIFDSLGLLRLGHPRPFFIRIVKNVSPSCARHLDSAGIYYGADLINMGKWLGPGRHDQISRKIKPKQPEPEESSESLDASWPSVKNCPPYNITRIWSLLRLLHQLLGLAIWRSRNVM